MNYDIVRLLNKYR